MKRKETFILRVLFIMLFGAFTLSSFADVPQKINYQAIARNAAGEVLSNENIDIKISILQSSADGSAVCIEEFDLETNEFGLVNLQIGSNNPVDFSAIDWSAGPYFVKLEINDIHMGTSQLFAVPYALYSEEAENAPKGNNPGDMSYWDGEQWVIIPAGENGQPLVFCNGVPQWGPCNDLTDDSPIFRIDNEKGNNVLAVYPGGVEINTDKSYDVPNKTARGGFAVGGFTASKTAVQLLDINVDSTRFYIQKEPLEKTARGGFAVGGFTSNKELSEDFVRITSDTTYIQTTLAAAESVFIGGDLNVDGSSLSSPLLSPTFVYIMDTSIECSSEILHDGGSEIVEVGFEFALDETFNDIVTMVAGELTETSIMYFGITTEMGLEPGQTYYIRAFAKNTLYTGYADYAVETIQ